MELARYARYFGIFLLCLTVAAWVGIQRRPAVKDTEVAAAVAWAQNAGSVTCQRPVLFGQPLAGAGSTQLMALIESHGCADPGCEILHDAVQHEEVCAPERAGDDLWLPGVLEHAATLDVNERLRLFMHALRAMDDLRRGELHTIALPIDTTPLHDGIRATLGEPLDEVDDLSRAADLLVETSPDFPSYAAPMSAGIIIHGLRGGRNRRHSRHPRAATVAWSNVAQSFSACPDVACIEATFAGIPQPEPVSKIRLLLQGAPVAHDFQIGGASRFAARRMRELMMVIEAQRATERLLAAALRILASCTRYDHPDLDDLSVERTSEVLRDTVIVYRELPIPTCR